MFIHLFITIAALAESHSPDIRHCGPFDANILFAERRVPETVELWEKTLQSYEEGKFKRDHVCGLNMMLAGETEGNCLTLDKGPCVQKNGVVIGKDEVRIMCHDFWDTLQSQKKKYCLD